MSLSEGLSQNFDQNPVCGVSFEHEYELLKNQSYMTFSLNQKMKLRERDFHWILDAGEIYGSK